MSSPVGVVLAAGLGTRLRPSTDRCPKPLIPVGGVEPLYVALWRLYSAGVRRFVVNVHHLPDLVIAALDRWSGHFVGATVRVSDERHQILGTGGGLIRVIQENSDWFKNSHMVVINGDTVTNVDLSPFVQGSNKSLFSYSKDPEHLKKYGPLWMNDSGAWVGIGRQAPQSGASAAHFFGVHSLASSLVQELAKTDRYSSTTMVDLFNGIYRPATDLGFSLMGVEGKAAQGNDDALFWFDMTSQEFLLEAQRRVLAMLRKPKSMWRELLVHRFPQIEEVLPGVWGTQFTTKRLQRAKAVGPCIWVETAQSNALQNGSEKIEFGPNAALICETPQETRFAASGCRLENCVLMPSPGSGLSIDRDFRDEVAVI